ncbi:MAG: beta-propeller fold lactonase family protein, partial [Silvibacterium sp.]
MKFSKTGQALLTAAVSIGIALGITSCGQSNTIDYLYVTASKNNPGQISVYRVDQESGAITQIQDSPYPSGGRNPVAEVTSPNGADLYVVNHDDNTVVEFAIGTDAKLYPQHTYQTPGTEPNAIAIN